MLTTGLNDLSTTGYMLYEPQTDMQFWKKIEPQMHFSLTQQRDAHLILEPRHFVATIKLMSKNFNYFKKACFQKSHNETLLF